MLRHAVFAWEGPALRFGLGATRDVGRVLAADGVSRALIVTDANVADHGVPERIQRDAVAAGVDAMVWAGSATEPTDRDVKEAVDELADERFDGYVAVGGGSCIDVCKLVCLLQTHGGPLERYLPRPHGAGDPVPGPLPPLVGVSTTAGTGSECTPVALVAVGPSHEKVAVTSSYLRPSLAVVDPLNTVSAPPAVTASAGHDAVVQAIESLTSRPFDRPPPTDVTDTSRGYPGANPVSDVFAERAVILAGRFLRRAVADGQDLEARVGMAQAALFSRIASAGVHVPHANAYGIVAAVRNYRPAGFRVERPLVPHGQSVIVTAAASFAFTYAGSPERHLQAARALGASDAVLRDRPHLALSLEVERLAADTEAPRLAELTVTPSDFPSIVAGAISQSRLLICSPREVTHADLHAVVRAAYDGSWADHVPH